MLTLRGEHFYFTEKIGVTRQIDPLPALRWPFSPYPKLPNLFPDALAGRISLGIGTLATAAPRNDL